MTTEDFILEITKNGWGFSAVLVIVIILYIRYPDNFEKIWARHVLGLLRFFSKKIDKSYIKYDTQGRMNSFIERMDKRIFSFSPVKIDIDFYDQHSDDNQSYLNDGKYYIRVRKSTNPNRNFVNIAMSFISDNLLRDAKKQISKKQKISIDLFVAKKLFQEEKSEVLDEFVSDFLQPQTDDDKVRELFDKFTDSDRAGLFFPVFLQEMTFLGRRVFSNPLNHTIREEVSNLINFLHTHANRTLGDDNNETEFIGKFSKFALMIVGVSYKVTEGNLVPYRRHLERLMRSGAESIYIIGHEKVQDFINQVSPDELLQKNNFYLFKNEKYKSTLKKSNGDTLKAETYLLLIRNKKIDPYIQNEL